MRGGECSPKEGDTMGFYQTIREAHGKRLLIGGHRGHTSKQRENTIANFEEVLRAGIDYIEIDVQLTKDQCAVIFHDETLSDRTPLNGYLRDYTTEELQSAFEINTLSETLAWCKKRGMSVLLEIKSKGLSDENSRSVFAKQMVKDILANDFLSSIIVFSIDYSILKMMKIMLPELHIGLIVPHPPKNPVQLIRDMDAILYLSYLDDLNSDVVDQLQSAGVIVDGSIVNTAEQLYRAVSMKVDMIESDDPETMRKIYQQRLRGEKE